MYRLLSSVLLAALGGLVWWCSAWWAGLRAGGATGYAIVAPAIAFFLAAIVVLFQRHDTPRHFCCSAMAGLFGLVATLIPGAWLELEISNYRGGGANIGLAFLWLALPLYAPIAMLAGYVLADNWLSRRA